MARKNKYSLPTIILLVVLVVGIGLSVFNFAPKASPSAINQIDGPAGEISLSLSPASINTTEDTESTVSLTANTGRAKLVVLTVELAYDPSKIRVSNVKVSDFLPNTIEEATISNGKIHFTYASTADGGGSSGIGEIAKISFKPVASGTSSLAFSTNSLATAVMNDKAIEGNSISSASDTIINVGSSATTDTIPTTPDNKSDLETTVDTDVKSPNLLQQTMLGWKLIFQSVFGVFSNK